MGDDTSRTPLDKTNPLEQVEAVERAVGGSLSSHQLALVERIAALRLTDKQKRYCERYVVHFDDVRAFQEAGYNANSAGAGVFFDSLRGNPRVQEYIDILRHEILRRVDVSVDDLLRETKAIATANIGDYVEWDRKGRVQYKPSSELTREQMAAILEIKESRYSDHTVITYKLHPKLQALNDLLDRIEELDKRKREKEGPVELRVNFQKVMLMLADPKARKAIETLSAQLFDLPMELSEVSKRQLDAYVNAMDSKKRGVKGGKKQLQSDLVTDGPQGHVPEEVDAESGSVIDVEVCEAEADRFDIDLS